MHDSELLDGCVWIGGIGLDEMLDGRGCSGVGHDFVGCLFELLLLPLLDG
jgi:hypothetical protein